jgi:hypothetical protein
MEEELQDYINKNMPKIAMANKGAKSEYNQYKALKQIFGKNNIEKHKDGNKSKYDFTILLPSGPVRMEHKRARNDCYANGDLKAELHKSRKSGNSKKGRLYEINRFDIASIDISEHTGIDNDTRYARIEHLMRHEEHEDYLKPMQRIPVDDFTIWKRSIQELLKS